MIPIMEATACAVPFKVGEANQEYTGLKYILYVDSRTLIGFSEKKEGPNMVFAPEGWPQADSVPNSSIPKIDAERFTTPEVAKIAAAHNSTCDDRHEITTLWEASRHQGVVRYQSMETLGTTGLFADESVMRLNWI